MIILGKTYLIQQKKKNQTFDEFKKANITDSSVLVQFNII